MSEAYSRPGERRAGRHAGAGLPKGLVGFTAGAVGFLLFGAFMAVEAVLFMSGSVKTEATVTGIGERKTCVSHAGRSSSTKYPCFPVGYRFTARDGRPVEFTERRAEDELPAVGDRAAVRYDPANPAGDVRFETGVLSRYGLPAACFLLGGAGTALGATLLRRYLRRNPVRPTQPGSTGR